MQKFLVPLILVLLLLGVFSYIGYNYYKNTLISVVKPITSPAQAVATASPSATTMAATLKTYYSENLDITVQYPADWKVTTGSYIGDMALGESGGCDYMVKTFQDYFKNPQNCNDKTIKNFTPGVRFTSADGKNKLEFAGPTSGLGGACPECVENPPTSFSVNGKIYSIKTTKMPTGVAYETLIGPAIVGIAAGPKSIWNKFDIYLEAQNKEIFDTEIAILESIK